MSCQRFAAFLLISLFTFPVYGECERQNYDSDEPPDFSCPSPDEDVLVPDFDLPASIPVEEGQSVLAPWPAALVARERLVYLGLRIRALRRLRWLDRQVARQRLEIETRYQRDVAQATISAEREQIASLRQYIERLEQSLSAETAWYRSTWFGLVLGIVISGALVAITAVVIAN